MDQERDDVPPVTRKPYDPPKILEQAEFESKALACGKKSGNLCNKGGGTKS